MRRRLLTPLPALAVAGALALTGCTSSGPAARGTSPSSGASAPSGATGSTAGTPVAPSAVADRLQAGLAGATSARLTISAALAGQTLAGQGQVALSQGAVTSADVTQALPGGLGTVRVVTVGAQSWAQLPAALTADRSKPWVRLDAGGTSPVVSELAATVRTVLAVASPAGVVALARAATSATQDGSTYHVSVPATALPAGVPSSVAGGRPALPLDITVDGSGRPATVHGTFTVSGQAITPTITLGGYDQPVTITAPPAGQVSGG